MLLADAQNTSSLIPANSMVRAILFYLSIALLSALMGLIAASSNVMILLIVAGMLIGVVLMANPTRLLWLLLIGGFVGAGSMQYFFGFARADWIVYTIAAALWLLALTSLVQIRRPWLEDTHVPLFVVLMFMFFGVGLLSSILGGASLVQVSVGLKNYFIIFAVVIAFYLMPWRRNMVVYLVRGVIIIGLLQWIVTFYQYFFVRSARLATGGLKMGGIGDNVVEASDSVVGTFGGQMLGGGAGTSLLPTFLAIQLAIVLSLFFSKQISKRVAVLLSVFLLVPVVLAETKVIFVYLPLIILLLTWNYFSNRPGTLIGSVLGVVGLVFVGLFSYQALHWSTGGGTLQENVEKFFSYSFAEKAGKRRAAMGNMTRLEALTYWSENQGLDDPKGFLVGDGLSASKSTSRVLASELVAEHGWKQLDKSTLSGLLWDTGIVGTALFMGALLSAYILAGRISLSPHLSDEERAIVKGLQAGLVVLVVSLPYTSAIMQTAQGTLMLYLVLGLIAYYARVADNERKKEKLLR